MGLFQNVISDARVNTNEKVVFDSGYVPFNSNTKNDAVLEHNLEQSLDESNLINENHSVKEVQEKINEKYDVSFSIDAFQSENYSESNEILIGDDAGVHQGFDEKESSISNVEFTKKDEGSQFVNSPSSIEIKADKLSNSTAFENREGLISDHEEPVIEKENSIKYSSNEKENNETSIHDVDVSQNILNATESNELKSEECGLFSNEKHVLPESNVKKEGGSEKLSALTNNVGDAFLLNDKNDNNVLNVSVKDENLKKSNEVKGNDVLDIVAQGTVDKDVSRNHIKYTIEHSSRQENHLIKNSDSSDTGRKKEKNIDSTLLIQNIDHEQKNTQVDHSIGDPIGDPVKGFRGNKKEVQNEEVNNKYQVNKYQSSQVNAEKVAKKAHKNHNEIKKKTGKLNSNKKQENTADIISKKVKKQKEIKPDAPRSDRLNNAVTKTPKTIVSDTPKVVIGQINVVVESQVKQNHGSSMSHGSTDFASRNYLRRL